MGCDYKVGTMFSFYDDVYEVIYKNQFNYDFVCVNVNSGCTQVLPFSSLECAEKDGSFVLLGERTKVREQNSNVKEVFDTYKNVNSTKQDMVNHPAHYNKGKYEPIEVIMDWGLGFNLGNTIKYISRCEHKGKKLEDLEKAMFYLKYEIDKIKAGE